MATTEFLQPLATIEFINSVLLFNASKLLNISPEWSGYRIYGFGVRGEGSIPYGMGLGKAGGAVRWVSEGVCIKIKKKRTHTSKLLCRPSSNSAQCRI